MVPESNALWESDATVIPVIEDSIGLKDHYNNNHHIVYMRTPFRRKTWMGQADDLGYDAVMSGKDNVALDERKWNEVADFDSHTTTS